ncbi:MAG: class II glutamine amidotransferase [Deltaproteobacteria bacterium]|nr:class II glutamine amidotransferase [Deltaproteobacteria bacterium]
MAHLIGILANRADLAGRLAAHERALLRCRAPTESALSWGLGFHRNGELLLRRRPLDERPTVDLAAMLDDVQTDLVVAHASPASDEGPRTENTPPFRYRDWLFAMSGTPMGLEDARAELVRKLPEFLRRSIRGETLAEVAFHLVLAELHGSGNLERARVDLQVAGAALHAALARIDHLAGAAARDRHHPRVGHLLATPEYLIVAHRGAPLAHRTLVGRADFEALFADERGAGVRMPDLEACALVVVASDLDGATTPSGWTPIPEDAMMAFRRADAPLSLSFTR